MANPKSTTSTEKEALKPVNSILITQSRPDDDSPYSELTRKYNLKIDFRPFIHIEGVSTRDFRKQKIDIQAHTAVIFTSKNAVDYFFALCKDLKIEVNPDMKYFCISPQTSNYLQKYIHVRKRKVFTGKKTAADMQELFKKHKNEKYLFPCSDVRRDDIANICKKLGCALTEAVMYRTVSSDLSDLAEVNYDIIVFFSPSGVTSLYENFPDFKQNETRIAAFGPTTAAAVHDRKLTLNIEAPLPNAPSMTGAIELYVRKANKLD
ncbi:MAG: uroporphyrinogen-III synthase [Cytophagales bacterium]|nr:MAG: uroporphyrinogen-III synthase [Cytophagales bacterium]TAF59969.1 MAG: uroporphyrinogen-III synthase [Cytophagales bacterium]